MPSIRRVVLLRFRVLTRPIFHLTFKVASKPENSIPERVDIETHSIGHILPGGGSILGRWPVVFQQQRPAFRRKRSQATVEAGKVRLIMPQWGRLGEFAFNGEFEIPIAPLVLKQNAPGNAKDVHDGIAHLFAARETPRGTIQGFVRAQLRLRAMIPLEVSDQFALEQKVEFACLVRIV